MIGPHGFHDSSSVGFIGALALPALAMGVELAFWETLRPFAWVLFYPAVFVAALIGGLWGGVAATLLATALAGFYLVPAQVAETPAEAALGIQMAIFAATGILFSVFAHRLSQKERLAERLAGNVRHRRLFERSRAGIVYLDGRGRYQDANPAFCALTGYSREEILGLDAYRIVDAGDHARLREYLASTRASDGLTTRWRLRRRDGQPAEVKALISREGDGSTMAIIHDISQRVHYERNLHAAHTLSQAVLDSVPAQMAVIDRDGAIVAINESWREFALHHCTDAGQLAGTAVGANLLDACRADHDSDNWVYTGILEVLHGRTEHFRGECRCESPAGEVLWFAMTVTPVAFPAGGAVVAYHDISDIHHAKDAEHLALCQVKTLAARQLVFQEEERLALSRELHDHVGQDLAALELALDQCARHMGPAPKAQAALWEARLTVKSILETTRDISRRLRPPLLDDLGLAAALRWHIDKLPRADVVGIRLDDGIGATRFHPDVELAAFRIAQEALSNALRHARAQEIHVCLEFDATGLGLRIRDDGVGFAAEEALERSRRLNSLGLLGMRERVATVGGRFRIESRPGAGTEVATLFYAPPNLQ